MRIKVALKEAVERRGKSLYWLAQKTGKQYTSIWQLANGNRDGVSFNVLESVCAALDCQPGEVLVLEEGEPHASRPGKPRNQM